MDMHDDRSVWQTAERTPGIENECSLHRSVMPWLCQRRSPRLNHFYILCTLMIIVICINITCSFTTNVQDILYRSMTIICKEFCLGSTCCGIMFLVERHVVRLTRVVELDSDDVVWGVHAHQVMHADEHAHTWTYTTLTFQHSQHSVHVFTKVFHLWGTLHSNHHFTHCHQGFLGGAPLSQAIIESLILIRCSCDHRAIITRNDSLLFKFYHNGNGIHISNEPDSEAVKNLFHCTEREELLHSLTMSNAHCRATLCPLLKGSMVCGDTGLLNVVQCTSPSLSFSIQCTATVSIKQCANTSMYYTYQFAP